MYRHCLFCSADLGSNEVVEPFPVGRRLAFDAAKGRLWVICRACERWNLTPLEERWEAVEDAERLFRETPLRASTEQVGLARHREGLDLVRIGAPQRPEFAAWRYGDQFGRRRRKYVVNTVVGVGLAGGLAVGSMGVIGSAVGLNVGLQIFNVVRGARSALRPALRLRLDDGSVLELGPRQTLTPKLRPGRADGAPDNSWHLALEHRGGRAVLVDQDAVRALRALLPGINRAGAAQRTVRQAVSELEEAGGPEAYFRQAELRARRQGMGYMTLRQLPRPIRLALEMAAHEDAERVALEGELAWLETAWREAEEIAEIADDLALPERVRIRLEELKARVGRRERDEASG